MEGIMTITDKNHDDLHWNFIFSDGSLNSVGKPKQTEGQTEGIETEQEAINLLQLNFPKLEI